MQWLYQQGSSHWQLSCNVFAIEKEWDEGAALKASLGPEATR